MPFLPGDSFLFLLGTIAGASLIDPFMISLTIFIAALLGDSTNFMVGRFFRGKISPHSRWIKRKYIENTERFFAKYGGVTLILARFTPIVRTYAPFVGGLSAMKYRIFIGYNVLGAFLWVAVFIPLGYLLGNNEFVSRNISKFVIIIVFLSLLPFAFGIIKNYFNTQKRIRKVAKYKLLRRNSKAKKTPQS